MRHTMRCCFLVILGVALSGCARNREMTILDLPGLVLIPGYSAIAGIGPPSSSRAEENLRRAEENLRRAEDLRRAGPPPAGISPEDLRAKLLAAGIDPECAMGKAREYYKSIGFTPAPGVIYGVSQEVRNDTDLTCRIADLQKKNAAKHAGE